MRRFRFRLEQILRLRENEMEEAKTALGRISSLCNKNQVEQDALAKERRRAFAMLSRDDASSNTPVHKGSQNILGVFGMRERYLARIHSNLERLFKERASLEFQREQAASLYQEKRISFEAVKLLKDKELRSYKRELEYEDQKFNDDVAASRFRPALSREE